MAKDSKKKKLENFTNVLKNLGWILKLFLYSLKIELGNRFYVDSKLKIKLIIN